MDFWSQPTEFIVSVLIAMVITELIKYPIKKKLGNQTKYGWLYILISVIVGTGVFAGYWYFVNDKQFVLDSATLHSEYLAFLAFEQLVFNFVWDKGLKAVVQKIISKTTGIDENTVNAVMEVAGVNDALEKIEVTDDTKGAQLEEVAEKGVGLIQRIKNWIQERKNKKSADAVTEDAAEKTLAKPISIHEQENKKK